MIVEIKQFRLVPRKIESKKIYTFQNDAEINYLSEQLRSIGEFNISSKEQMYAKDEELKVKKSSDTRQLKRVTDLIRAYESIVDGNYIDNLIKKQKE